MDRAGREFRQNAAEEIERSQVPPASPSALIALEHESGIDAAKAERVRQHCVHDLRFCRLGDQIEPRRLRVRMLEVERCRQHAVPQRLDRDHRLDSAGGAKHVPGRGLGRRYRKGLAAIAEYGADAGLITSFPIRTTATGYEIVKDVPVNAFSRAKIDATLDELREEKAMVAELLG